MIGRYPNGKNTEEPIREKRESADDSYWLIQEGRRQGKKMRMVLFFLANNMANLYFWLSVEAKSIQIMIGFSYKRLDFFTGL